LSTEVTLSSTAQPIIAGPDWPAPRSPANWCLFLDVDGTLLDIAPTPDGVVVDAALPALLKRVRDALDGALALVSGRSLEQIDALFAPCIWPAAGLHGLERRDADGRIHLAGAADPALDEARTSLADVVARAPGALLEDKGRSLAVHYRAAPALEHVLRRELRAIAARLGDDFHVLEGRRVLELKPVAATKARAIEAFLAEAPFVGRLPMFIGDDVTDLDGFAAVEAAGGVSIAVGDRVEAMLRVASPRDVRVLLADIAEQRVSAP
jgi:trehalose 6-phosphate phosphatase